MAHTFSGTATRDFHTSALTLRNSARSSALPAGSSLTELSPPVPVPVPALASHRLQPARSLVTVVVVNIRLDISFLFLYFFVVVLSETFIKMLN